MATKIDKKQKLNTDVNLNQYLNAVDKQSKLLSKKYNI